VANLDMTVNMVVPTSGSLEEIIQFLALAAR
jgi:hypothetical protein